MRRRAAHPVCEHCEARGIVRAADEMDHVLPLALGGLDVDENIQGLCLACHAIKTALEQASAGGAANHPDWLRPASCRLTIVAGPPCAGKSTLIDRDRGGLDVVIDLDELAALIQPSFKPARRWTSDLLNQSIRARNALLGSLSRLPPRSSAWFAISAPTVHERQWWTNALKPERLILLDPGREQCLARARQRRGAEAITLQAVEDWYVRASGRWSPAKAPRKRLAIGVDGYPIEEESKA